jgi:hypothetical protein
VKGSVFEPDHQQQIYKVFNMSATLTKYLLLLLLMMPFVIIKIFDCYKNCMDSHHQDDETVQVYNKEAIQSINHTHILSE